MTRPDFYGMVDFIQNGRLRPAVSFFVTACDSLRPNKGDNKFRTNRRRYSQAAIHDIRFAPVFSGGYLCDWICAGISGDDLYYRTRTGIPGRLFIIADRCRCPGRQFMLLDLRRYSWAAIYQDRPLPVFWATIYRDRLAPVSQATIHKIGTTPVSDCGRFRVSV